MEILYPIKDRPSESASWLVVNNLKKLHEKRGILYEAFPPPIQKEMEKHFEKMRIPNLSFKLRGMAAGSATPNKHLISINCILLNNPDHREEQGTVTLAHEYAHLLVSHISKFTKKRYPPHGEMWKGMMAMLGYRPDRCHTMKVEKSKRTRVLDYECSCGTTQIPRSKHLNIKKNKYTVLCTKCNTRLKKVKGKKSYLL